MKATYDRINGTLLFIIIFYCKCIYYLLQNIRKRMTKMIFILLDMVIYHSSSFTGKTNRKYNKILIIENSYDANINSMKIIII